MAKIKIDFKRDKYREARGNYSRFLDIFCSHCGEKILLYQKDGPGPLKRLYLDRIFAPIELTKWQEIKQVEKVPQLICKTCNRLIAIPAMYEKEDRKALLLLSHTFIKKIVKK